MSSKYPRYHDYVIKDGKLVGEFEEMYQDFEDPWEQSTREQHSLEKKIGIQLIKNKKFSKVLELGCGFGHFINEITHECKCLGVGLDISNTAITKGRIKYGNNKNIILEQGTLTDTDILTKHNPDIIIMAEITWYVLEELHKFKNILSKYFKGKYLLHQLMTYKPGVQKYGIDYFTNIDEIMSYFSDCIEFENWGKISSPDMDGGARTFFLGKIK